MKTLWELAQEMRSWDDGATPKDYAKAVEQWAREKAKDIDERIQFQSKHAGGSIRDLVRMYEALGVPEEQ